MRWIALLIIPAIFMLTAATAFNSTAYAAVDVTKVCNSGGAGGTDASGTRVCKDVTSQSGNSNPVISIIKSAITLISYLTGIAAIILIIISGIQFVLSNGDSSSVASARNTLIYALVGVAVTVLAQVIVVFVLDKIIG